MESASSLSVKAKEVSVWRAFDKLCIPDGHIAGLWLICTPRRKECRESNNTRPRNAKGKKARAEQNLEWSQKHEMYADSKCVFPLLKNEAALIP